MFNEGAYVQILAGTHAGVIGKVVVSFATVDKTTVEFSLGGERYLISVSNSHLSPDPDWGWFDSVRWDNKF